MFVKILLRGEVFATDMALEKSHAHVEYVSMSSEVESTWVSFTAVLERADQKDFHKDYNINEMSNIITIRKLKLNNE